MIIFPFISVRFGRVAFLSVTLLAAGTGACFAQTAEDCGTPKGNDDWQIIACTEAILRNPRNPGAYSVRGLSYHNKREYDRAIAEYNEALRIDPRRVQTLIARGQVYHAKRDYDRAIADYTQSIMIEHFTNSSAYLHLGHAYRAKGDKARAIANYRTALALNPKDEVSFRALQELGGY